ncbi:hypothetical protein Tco_1373736, partial [Tanacetum coccineum]
APPSPDYVPDPEHPPSPDYVPGLEEPEQTPLSPDYVPEPEYPKYLVPSSVEDPADGGEDDDDESSEDDADDEDKEEASEEEDDDEEEEHLALADSAALSAVDPVPSAEDTEAFETDKSAPKPPTSPHHIILFSETRPRTTQMSVRPHTQLSPSIPLPPLPVPSPPLPLPSPPTHTSPSYADAPLGYRADRIQLRATSPPLLLPSTTHRDDIPEADMPLQKRAHFTALASRFEVGKSSVVVAARQPGLDVDTMDATLGRPMSREVGYGIEDVWDDMVGDMEERARTTVEGLSQRVTDLFTALARDTHEIYVRLEDAQDD